MSVSPEDLELKALFAADEPPRHDHGFVAEVAERVARQRLIEELVGWGMASLIAAVVLWALGPVLAPFAKPLATLATLFLPAIAVLTGVAILVHPRTHPA
jgi:hypothetical protein